MKAGGFEYMTWMISCYYEQCSYEAKDWLILLLCHAKPSNLLLLYRFSLAGYEIQQ